MDKINEISIETVKRELENCNHLIKKYNWEISEIDEQDLLFTVKMVSPIDNEIYLIEFKFDNYPEKPLLIEFIQPDSGEKGTKKAYPKSKNHQSFFNPNNNNKPCICHPCSRLAYKEHGGPHNDWQMNSWKQNTKTSSLINIPAILNAIFHRIDSDTVYGGRMEK